MEKQMINMGHTNKIKYRQGNELVIKKTYTGFNHKLDYSVLHVFDFVPKLIRNNKEEVVWEYIDGEILSKPSDDDLKEVARILRVLHKSEITLPKNNFRKRFQEYIKTGHEKGHKIPEIENNWRKMNQLTSKMQKINPSHNDVWWQNLIKDKNGKIWLVDWEYATMGDKHFDLGHFIESSKLSREKADIFLEAYNSHDSYQAWIPEWMPNWIKFVNWFILVWANAQDKEPFDLSSNKSKLK